MPAKPPPLRNLHGEYQQILTILDKIELLLRHLATLERGWEAPPATTVPLARAGADRRRAARYGLP